MGRPAKDAWNEKPMLAPFHAAKPQNKAKKGAHTTPIVFPIRNLIGSDPGTNK